MVGGYTAGSGMGDCGCPAVDECGNPIEAQPLEWAEQPVEFEGECGGCETGPMDGMPTQVTPAIGVPVEGQFMLDDTIDGQESLQEGVDESQSESVLAAEDNELITDDSDTRSNDNVAKRPSFLKRFRNWLTV